MRKGSLFRVADSKDALAETLKLISNHSRDYIIFSEKGEILHRSDEKTEPPKTYKKDSLRSITAKAFSGKDYYLRIDEKQQVMYCYIPLSGFQLGNSILLIKKNMGSMNESLMHLYSQAVYVILIIFFFHAIFAVVLFRYIIQPVNLLSRGAKSLSEGKLGTRIPLYNRNDEFAALAMTFNQMAESIHKNIESLSGEIDIARESAEKSERMATRDELTGLYNRYYFLERLDEEMNKQHENNSAVVLALMELDNFGEISSIYGHQTENIILSETAKSIVRASSGSEIIARYGDTVFAMLSTGMIVSEIQNFAEKIRRAIEEKPVLTPDGGFRVAVSIGVAHFTAFNMNGKDIRLDFLKLAEAALLKAKESGRNRVEIVS